MKINTTLLILFLFISSQCFAELLWTPKTEIWNKNNTDSEHLHHKTSHSMGHTRPKEKAFYLMDNNQAAVKIISPDLKVRLIKPAKQNKFILPKTGMDNYHSLIAEQTINNTRESAIRYIYMRGKPSGHSPSELLRYPKLKLEIIPDPMVREHWRFYTQDKHAFIIHYDHKPLKDNWVVLQTSNGTTLDAKTDNNGRVTFILPDDFKNIKPGRRANPGADFLIRTVHIDGNQTYKTNFTAPYYVNPSHWQSNIGGLIALSIGFISGLIIMKKHNKNHSKNNRTGKKS